MVSLVNSIKHLQNYYQSFSHSSKRMKKREHFLTQSRGQPYSDTKGKQRHYRQKINYRPIFLTNINVKTSTYTRRQSSATYQKNYTLWRILHHVKSWCKMIIFFFILLMCIILIDCHMLNNACIPGVNPNLSWILDWRW